jgi:hypothetical protein
MDSAGEQLGKKSAGRRGGGRSIYESVLPASLVARVFAAGMSGIDPTR